MKIGIDIRLIGKQRTGDEVVFFNLVKNLARIDEKNEYLLFTDVADAEALELIGERLGIVDRDNFRIVSLKTKNRFSWNFWTLPRYLRSHDIDIYHTQYITPWFVPRSVKIITIIHDVSFKVFGRMIKASDRFFLSLLIPHSIRRADLVVAVSEFTKREIIRYYGVAESKVAVVHNALGDEYSENAYDEIELDKIRVKYHLPKKFLLYIGTLQPRKNIPYLLEAFELLRRRDPEMKLVLAGNRQAHNYDKHIDENIERLRLAGDVIFPGYVSDDDKKGLYQLAGLFVFPSRYEGFGIPVLEALSLGIPVACADIASLRETAGDAAIYFPLDRLDETADVLYTSSKDKGVAGSARISGPARARLFSWERSARKYLAIYEQLLYNENK